jgi:hypothetical protein
MKAIVINGKNFYYKSFGNITGFFDKPHKILNIGFLKVKISLKFKNALFFVEIANFEDPRHSKERLTTLLLQSYNMWVKKLRREKEIKENKVINLYLINRLALQIPDINNNKIL